VDNGGPARAELPVFTYSVFTAQFVNLLDADEENCELIMM